jgi:uncharacterized protein
MFAILKLNIEINMDIKEELVLLAELGLIEQKITEAQDKLKSLPKQAELVAQKAKLTKSEKDKKDLIFQTLQIERRKKDQELQNDKSNLRKWEERADKIKGEREYTALMSEIGAHKRSITQKEAEIIEINKQTNLINDEVAKLSEQASLTQQDADKEYSLISESMAKNQQIVEQLESNKQKFLEKLPRDLTLKYSRIADRKQGKAIAFIKKEVCQSCRRMVPPELSMKIKASEIIEQCPSCHRILVADELVFKAVKE